MTTQTESLIDERHLQQGAWLIKRININYEAHTLEITADYDEDTEFQLIFRNFYLISWQILEDEYDPREGVADVIGMEFGEDAHRKPAIITADLFEIIVSYGELEIVKV